MLVATTICLLAQSYYNKQGINKKGDKTDPNNYRPITIIPIFSKILEKAMLIRLNRFLTKHNILQKEQFGFRKGSSTTLACFNLIKLITENINNGTPTISLFLDMSKAFDYVSHSKLLHKLDYYGIRGKACEWLSSYLKNRKQYLEITKTINNSQKRLIRQTFRSEPLLNTTGVPQGSILGPLLFLIYINDLPQSIPHNCILFADDTTIVVKCDNKQQYQITTNKALDEVITWMKNNNLNVNINKTKIVQFSSYNSNITKLDIKYNYEQIEDADNVKFLGICLDKHLNWKMHVEHVCQKLERYVYALKKIRQTVSLQAALTAYHGYVASIISYGIIIWGNSVDIDRVFKVQKRCIRVINKAWFLDSCKPLYKACNILPVPCIYILETCVFVKSHPESFIKRSDILTRQKRTKFTNTLYLPPCHKYIYKHNICYLAIKIYNALPNYIMALDGNIFKNCLRDWLLKFCFYSLKDYFEYTKNKYND